MKIKVISENVIHHGKVFGVGSIIDDIDKENAKRLCLNGICELVDGNIDDVKDGNTDVETGEEIQNGIDLDELTKKELVEYAKNLGIEDVDTRNTKAEIIEKISSVDAPITEMP